MKHIAVLINSASGRNDSRGQIEAAFKKAGLEADFIEIGSGFQKKLAEAFDSGLKTFVAAGGDGTVNALVSEVYNQKVTIGIIPTGTLNHFAKDLGLPQDIEQAVSVIAGGKARLQDIGIVNGQIFINNSSIGIYARVARTKKRTKMWLLRFAIGIASAFWFIFRPPSYNVNLDIDGKRVSRRTPIVFVGNNKYDLSNLGLSNRHSINKGTLCVYIIKTHNPLLLILVSLGILLGRVNSAYFEQHDATELVITTSRRRLLVSYDGEVKKTITPLNYSILPSTIKIIC